MPIDPEDWGPFETVRDGVRYDMSGELSERYPTSGQPRTIQNVCRVPWSEKDRFLAAILPDVSEGSQDTGQVIDLGSAGTNTMRFNRQPLLRKCPEPHPTRKNLWVVEASVLRGEGAPRVSTDGQSLVFNEGRSNNTGFALIAVTWSDLPYSPCTVTKTIEGRTQPVPDEPTSDADCNGAGNSEIGRYVKIKSTNRGSNLQIKSRQLYFVDDDGTPVRQKPGDPTSPILPVPEANQARYVPSQLFTVTWYMVPRVPLALSELQNHVNGDRNLAIPFDIFPVSYRPELGTLLAVGFDLGDPYYTFSGQKVYDLQAGLLWRPNGDNKVQRGHNASWCGPKKSWRRVVAAEIQGTTILRPATLPKSGSFATQDSDIITPENQTLDEHYNIHPFAVDFSSLFRFEGAHVDPSS